MKKVALSILLSLTVTTAVLTANFEPTNYLLVARLHPPTKVVEAAEAIALEKSPKFEIRYEKQGGLWTALIYNYYDDGEFMDVDLFQFKANGKRMD